MLRVIGPRKRNGSHGFDVSTTGVFPPSGFGMLGSFDGGFVHGNKKSGLKVLSSSHLTVNNSVFLGNFEHGVWVSGGSNIGPAFGCLGTGCLLPQDTKSPAGNNVLQHDDSDGDANGLSGICASYPVTAQGNIFGAGKNCATTAAKLTTSTNCGHADIGGFADVSMCTY